MSTALGDLKKNRGNTVYACLYQNILVICTCLSRFPVTDSLFRLADGVPGHIGRGLRSLCSVQHRNIHGGQDEELLPHPPAHLSAAHHSQDVSIVCPMYIAVTCTNLLM